RATARLICVAFTAPGRFTFIDGTACPRTPRLNSRPGSPRSTATGTDDRATAPQPAANIATVIKAHFKQFMASDGQGGAGLQGGRGQTMASAASRRLRPLKRGASIERSRDCTQHATAHAALTLKRLPTADFHDKK